MKSRFRLAMMFVVALIVPACLAAPAHADPPVWIDDMVWLGEDEPNQAGAGKLTYETVEGGEEFEGADECSSALYAQCELFPGGAPIVNAPQAGTYPWDSYGFWVYTAPGGPDTYLKSVSAKAINTTGDSPTTMETSEPIAALGTWNPDEAAWPALDFTKSSGLLELSDEEGEEGVRQLRIGLVGEGLATPGQDHWAALMSAQITLGDDVAPEMTIDMPDGWIDETPYDLPVTVEDNGFGFMQLLALGSKRNPTNPFDWYGITTETDFCDLVATPIECPRGTPPGYTVQIEPAKMREGDSALLSFGAYDPMENGDVQDKYFKIDTMDPVVNLSGGFTTAPSMILTGPSYTLNSDSTDGTGSGVTANSGVVGLEVLIDDVVIDSDSQSCANKNCPLGLETEIDPDNFTNGDHVLKVKATDAVGHVKTETVEFEVDR